MFCKNYDEKFAKTNKWKYGVGIGIIAIIFSGITFKLSQPKDNNLDDLRVLNAGTMPDILYDSTNEAPKFISGKYTDAKITNEEDAIKSLDSVKTIMKLSNPTQEFTSVNVTDFENSTTYRLQQSYKNIPVYDSQVIVSTDKNGVTTSLSGNYKPGINIDVMPKVSREDDERTVMSRYTGGIKINSTELVIYTSDGGQFYLVWKSEVFGVDDKEKAIHELVFVDAEKNEVISTEQKIFYDAVSAEGIDGLSNERNFTVDEITNNKFEMFDPNRKIITLTSGSVGDDPIVGAAMPTSTNNTWTDKAAVSAHANLSVTMDYYKNVLSRHSFDNQGERVASYVHVKDSGKNSGKDWDNACYSDDKIYFGDGKNDYNPLSYGLDIVAHEFTHGVVAHTARLKSENTRGDK